MTSPLRWLLGLLCCLPAAGCCSIAQAMTALFCGPSKTPWLRVSYRTPGAALLTFQKAVARDDVGVIYNSISPDWKRRDGFGRFEAEKVWKILKQKYPGIHTVGLAKIVQTPIQEPTLVEHILEVAFHQFRVRLKRYEYWRVVVPGPDPEEPIPKGAFLSSFSQNLRITHQSETSTVDVHIPGIEAEELIAEDILEVTLGREWKVDLFVPVATNKTKE